MATKLLALANALSITATGAQAAILVNTSPFLGGQSHNAVLDIDGVPAGGGVIAIQGSSNDIHNPPGTSDPSWTTIATINASSPLEQEINLPQWIRVNITTIGTGTFTARLNGIQ